MGTSAKTINEAKAIWNALVDEYTKEEEETDGTI